MLLMVALLVTMSASAAARRYAKISRAWVEHDVILDGQRGMKVHLYLTVSGMKRRSVSLTGEVTLDSDVAGDDPVVIYRCDGALMPSHDIDTYLDYTLFVNLARGRPPLLSQCPRDQYRQWRSPQHARFYHPRLLAEAW